MREKFCLPLDIYPVISPSLSAYYPFPAPPFTKILHSPFFLFLLYFLLVHFLILPLLLFSNSHFPFFFFLPYSSYLITFFPPCPILISSFPSPLRTSSAPQSCLLPFYRLPCILHNIFLLHFLFFFFSILHSLFLLCLFHILVLPFSHLLFLLRFILLHFLIISSFYRFNDLTLSASKRDPTSRKPETNISFSDCRIRLLTEPGHP